MKVISLLQPWASLVVLGHKKIETRSWNTKYRGELLIHASKKWNNELYQTIIDIGAENCLQKSGYRLTTIKNGKIETNLPLGAIIGKVNLVHTFNTNDFRNELGNHITAYIGIDGLSPQEEVFGDYSRDRFCWLLSDPIIFEKPIPAKGKLGLWNFEVPKI